MNANYGTSIKALWALLAVLALLVPVTMKEDGTQHRGGRVSERKVMNTLPSLKAPLIERGGPKAF